MVLPDLVQTGVVLPDVVLATVVLLYVVPPGVVLPGVVPLLDDNEGDARLVVVLQLDAGSSNTKYSMLDGYNRAIMLEHAADNINILRFNNRNFAKKIALRRDQITSAHSIMISGLNRKGQNYRTVRYHNLIARSSYCRTFWKETSDTPSRYMIILCKVENWGFFLIQYC